MDQQVFNGNAEVFRSPVQQEPTTVPGDPQRFIIMAYWMSKFGGYDAIFRRFDDLNLLNLLCLQDELVTLRKTYRRLCPGKILPTFPVFPLFSRYRKRR